VSPTLSEVATYPAEEPANALARYLARLSVPCTVDFSESPGLGRYQVRVPSDQIEEVIRTLSWTKLTAYDDPMSSQVFAGRLAVEDIPCLLGGMYALNHYGFAGRYSSSYDVSVPKECLSRAQKVLNEPPFTDEELTKLALGSRPEDS